MSHPVKVFGLMVLVFLTLAFAYAQDGQHADHSKPNEHGQQNQGASRGRSTEQTQRASNNRGGRIPDASFRAHFGRDHDFRINRPEMVAGYPRFEYGGYWFRLANPRPAGWYHTDPVYVDYINGGDYLLSPVHPGIQIPINVIP
jgi:hypothetical protein